MRELSLPAAYLEFLERFARGEYWEAHEVLEGAWRESRSGFYKGLILLASAWVHAGRRNAHGVRAQLRKAERELAPYAPVYLGQDVAGLLAHCQRVAAADDVWSALPAPPELAPRAALLRGDEPELGST